MNIRKCNQKDLDEVLILENNSFKHPYKKSDLEYELLKNKLSHFYVIEDLGKIVGFIIFMITFNSSTICQIAVMPESRKKGYGSKLLKEMETAFLKQKDVIETCTLEVRTSNIEAINFYKKNGFNEVLIKDKYYEDGESAIYMVKYYL